MTSSSVSAHIQNLENKDYLEKQDPKYTFIDPLIKTALNMYFGIE